jgi:hypothetical protein
LNHFYFSESLSTLFLKSDSLEIVWLICRHAAITVDCLDHFLRKIAKYSIVVQLKKYQLAHLTNQPIKIMLLVVEFKMCLIYCTLIQDEFNQNQEFDFNKTCTKPGKAICDLMWLLKQIMTSTWAVQLWSDLMTAINNENSK